MKPTKVMQVVVFNFKTFWVEQTLPSSHDTILPRMSKHGRTHQSNINDNIIRLFYVKIVVKKKVCGILLVGRRTKDLI